MAIYTNLPIYQSAYSLLKAFVRIMPDMPRDCRYSLGQDTRKRIMDIILLVYKANRTRKKNEAIAGMREALVEIQVSLRIMCDLRYMSEGCYVSLAEYTVSMSKQLAAWEKNENRKNNDGTQGSESDA